MFELRNRLQFIAERFLVRGPASVYGLSGSEVDFKEIRHAVAERNETALGVRLVARKDEPDDEVIVNPPRDRRFVLGPRDELVVLVTYH